MMKNTWSRLLSAVLALCLCVTLAPAAFAAETLPEVQTITLRTAAVESGVGQYSVTYSASLTMGEQFAKIVAVNKEDSASLKKLRFTCTLEDTLVKQLTSVSQSDFTFSGSGVEIFDFVEAKVSDSSGITLVYKLKESVVESWYTATTESVKELLDQQMTMTATETVTSSQLNDAKDSSGAIKTSARVEISMSDNANVPFYGVPSVVAAEGESTMTVAGMVYTISGIVREADGTVLPGVIVRLQRGNTTIFTATTDENGVFTIYNVSAGIYNIVTMRTVDGTSQTMTILEEITDHGDVVYITMPALAVNSELVVVDESSPGAVDSHQIMVGGLDEEAENAAENESDAQTVTVTMTVAAQKENSASMQQKAIQQVASGQSLEYVDMTIVKTVTTSSGGITTTNTERITDAQQVLEVVIPYDFTNKQNVKVYRYHGTGAEKLQPINGRSDDPSEGTYYLDRSNGLIHIYAQKFSLYAVGYSSSSGGSGNSDAGSGSSAATTYPVEVGETEQGMITANYTKAAAGTLVSLQVSPADGYRLGSLRVTDNSGNEIEVTANEDGTYSFTMPSSKVIVAGTFLTAIALPDDTGVADLLNTTDHICYMVGYGDGLFGPDDDVTRAQVAQIFYRLLKDQNVAITASFIDVPEDAWYAAAVNTLASLGIVAGVGDGRFEPERAITRAEFATIAVRFAKETVATTIRFDDVPETYWAYQYINSAAAYGWVAGIGNDLFAPGDNITRAQAAAIVNRMTGRLGDQPAIDRGEGTQFPDVPQTYWAWYDIAEATTEHEYQMNDDHTKETWIK